MRQTARRNATKNLRPSSDEPCTFSWHTLYSLVRNTSNAVQSTMCASAFQICNIPAEDFCNLEQNLRNSNVTFDVTRQSVIVKGDAAFSIVHTYGGEIVLFTFSNRRMRLEIIGDAPRKAACA